MCGASCCTCEAHADRRRSKRQRKDTVRMEEKHRRRGVENGRASASECAEEEQEEREKEGWILES
eukprot:5975866-Pleurochrysis_carterae.AAC.1